MEKIILASGSPRRKEILTNAGLEFEVVVSDADESEVDAKNIPTALYVQELALLKAGDVCRKIKDENCLIIGADTVVFGDGKILGKPKDAADAKKMLETLSGKCHSVYTGICVMDSKSLVSVCKATETKVYFKQLDGARIERYVKTGEPMDKAGAYGIQGKGAMLVDKIEGDYLNVVGLPIAVLAEILETEFDFDIFEGER